MTTVNQALSRIMAELPAIGKDGRGPRDQGGYAYRGIEQITREVQPLLAKHGVVIAPKATVVSIGPAPGYKESWTTTVLSVAWTIIGPEGDAIEAQTIGIGHDSSDKGANKSMSQAFKYLLLDLFCISDAKDDTDGADYSHGEQARAVVPKTPGQALFDRLTLATPGQQKELRALKLNFKDAKLTAASFDADDAWLDAVVAVLDKEES